MLAIKGDGEEGGRASPKCDQVSGRIADRVASGPGMGLAGIRTLLDGSSPRLQLISPRRASRCTLILACPFGDPCATGSAATPISSRATWKKQEHMPSWPCNSRWKTMKDSGKGFRGLWLGRVLAKTDPTQIEAAEQQILQGISLLEELGLAAVMSLRLSVARRGLR